MSETQQDTIIHNASHLVIGVDHVIHGQGIDSAHPSARSPQLVRLAQRAIEIGQSLIEPTAVYRYLEICEVQHEQLHLAGGHTLQGALIGQHLSRADAVVVALCTIGHKIDPAITASFKTDPAFALALDGFGSAAVEALANTVCRNLEREAADRELRTSIPLSPGMIGWPVDQGQPQIFSILDSQSIGISLNDTCMMTPKKSLSFIIGEGPNLETKGNTCGYCAMNETCRYQDHYDPQLI